MAHAPLHPDARSFLAREVGRAREIAEKGARASLTALAVADKVVPAHFTEAQRKLRNRLRAHARQLGDERTADGQQEVNLLTEEVAYQHWHRMLFARFLAENGLLREDEGDQPIDLDECRALAADRRLDIWVYAALCAQKMLPGVFRLDDPALELKLDGAAQVELNGLMAGLQPEIFKTTDALGWVYQYWQAKRKDEVNDSGGKIGPKEIAPITQLFTEDYMVDFLLHNTLGAWWAGKQGPIEAATEEQARAKAGLPAKNGLPAVEWAYLRFVQDAETKMWAPAGGTFDGWPMKAKDITFIDPCMGSGHFPAFALPLLARMRMEEGGSAAENVYAVLNEQIHGLELDQRCCQIGAFNLALTAWKLAGFQQLPALNVACCGITPRAKLEEWVRLAGEDDKLKAGMARLHKLFVQAPILGSLINPAEAGYDDLLSANYKDLRPLLEAALSAEIGDESTYEMAVAAKGVAKAAALLAGEFVLVATNVPYLARTRHPVEICKYADKFFNEAKTDLATIFISRCMQFVSKGCTGVFVSPQNWNFQDKYEKFRVRLLQESRIHINAQLGPGAFTSISGEVVKPVLSVISNCAVQDEGVFFAADYSAEESVELKAAALTSGRFSLLRQVSQQANPSSRILSSSLGGGISLLDKKASYHNGICSGDVTRFTRYLWELPSVSGGWTCQQGTTDNTSLFTGMDSVFFWQEGSGDFYNFVCTRLGAKNAGTWIRGKGAWGRRGVLVSTMGNLQTSLYVGDLFDSNTVAVLPYDENDLPALWAFVSSDEYAPAVRCIDQSLKVYGPLVEVGFDIDRWRKEADRLFPLGLPKPYSSNPTQWLFSGHPHKSDNPLQVAVARLLCYQWPRQTGSSFLDCPALAPDGLARHADDDGIVALSSINREEAAATRVRSLLKDAYGAEWQEGITERQLLSDAGHGDSTLEEWLRDSFFEEHCKLFHHRPFVWHIWDGERDGFHALVNYHRLAAPNGEGARLLQKLAQTYLGDWIARCEADVKNEKTNAHKLLKAAKDLQADLLKILEGEVSHDIFVRWKPLHEQSIGWNPDINDGVRLNIRPFLKVRDVGKKGAGILKFKPNIKWEKDRGSEPERLKAQFPWFWSCLPEDKPEHVTDFAGGAEFTGERWNNLHHTLAAKKAARAKFIPKK